MEFFIEYGLFLAKAVTILVCVLVTVGFMAAMNHRKSGTGEGNIEVKSYNDQLQQMNQHMKQAVLDKSAQKADRKAEKAEKKKSKLAAKQMSQQAAQQESSVPGSVANAATQNASDAQGDAQSAVEAQSTESIHVTLGATDAQQAPDSQGDAQPAPDPKATDANPADTQGEAAPQIESDAPEVALKASESQPPGTHVGQAKSNLFVIDFEGDIQASKVTCLREEITAILSIASERDEVLVRVESPGGLIPGYGLAASQLLRIRRQGIPLTVAVDKVAASGGYMMACIANRIIAAPFAVLGSIGVVAQVPNFHRFLQGKDIDVEVMTAGEYKRTLTLFGENTEAGREKFQSELDDIHLLFKDFVAEHRPGVNMDEVGTGEAWYGRRALERHLIDELKSSDEYMIEQAAERQVFQVKYVQHKSRLDRFMDKFTRLSSLLGKVDSPHNHIQ